MEQYLISRDGVELSRHDSYLEAVGQLHRIQGQSADWAIKYEGYAITEAPAPDHIVSRLMPDLFCYDCKESERSCCCFNCRNCGKFNNGAESLGSQCRACGTEAEGVPWEWAEWIP